MKKKFDLKIWQRNRKIFILGYGMSQVDQKRPPWINAKLKICHMKLQYQIGSICKSGVRAFITKRGKGWFMSKPLRINGVRHTLVEKWLLLSPWEYPRLLSNVPGSDYASEVFSYSKALRCTFFGELKSSCSSKSCIIRSVVCNTVFKNKKSLLLKVSTL